MIRGTVALPVWRSKSIAWLCMESLCAQLPPVDKWELIVFEEEHEEQLGYCFFMGYGERLSKVGCERVTYLTCPEKYALSQKWVLISRDASPSSEYFCMCAADNYYSPYMLREAEDNIKHDNWCVTPKGYFWDFATDKVLRYELPGITGLQMTARTELVKKFPLDVVNKGVDSWFSRQIGSRGTMFMDNRWRNILCTNGLNNISLERYQHFDDPQPPFHATKTKLSDIVPDDIYKRLKTLQRCLKSQLS